MKTQTRFHLAIAILVLLSLFQSPSQTTHAKQSQQLNTMSVSGRVTDPSGHGVPGVTILATADDWRIFLPLIQQPSSGSDRHLPSQTRMISDTQSDYSVVTNEDGQYTLDGLPSRPYRILAQKDAVQFSPGFLTVPSQLSQNVNFSVTEVAPEIAPQTEIISPETNAALKEVAADGTSLVFDQSSPELDHLSPGDIIVSGSSTAAPAGYLRRVVSVLTEDGDVTVITEPAVLEEAVVNGSIYYRQALTPADVEDVSTLPGVQSSRSAAAISSTFTYNLADVVLYDQDGNLLTKDDQIKANGRIEFELVDC